MVKLRWGDGVSRFDRFEKVTDILPRMLQSFGQKKKYKEYLLFFYWERIVGEAIAGHVHPVRLSFHTLLLAADAPAWADTLKYMQKEIIDKINAFVCERLVMDLRFTISTVRHPMKQQKPAAARQNFCLRPDELEVRQAAERCASVQNQELRQKLARLYASDLERRKKQQEAQWHQCASCSVLCPADRKYCSACERHHRQQVEAKIREILEAKPWARYPEIYEYVHCTPAMANNQRVAMMQRLSMKIASGDTKSMDAQALVMLYDSVPPEQLTPERMEKVIHRMRWDLRPLKGHVIKKNTRKG